MGKVLKSVAIAAVFIGVGIATGGIGFIPAMTLPATGAVVGGSLVISGTLGAALAAMAVSTVLSGVSAQLFGPKMPKAQMSRLNPTLEPQAHRKFVFGETAMNTDVRYYETSGTDQEYFDYIIATSAHEVESIDEIWFDDQIDVEGARRGRPAKCERGRLHDLFETGFGLRDRQQGAPVKSRRW